MAWLARHLQQSLLGKLRRKKSRRKEEVGRQLRKIVALLREENRESRQESGSSIHEASIWSQASDPPPPSSRNFLVSAQLWRMWSCWCWIKVTPSTFYTTRTHFKTRWKVARQEFYSIFRFDVASKFSWRLDKLRSIVGVTLSDVGTSEIAE